MERHAVVQSPDSSVRTVVEVAPGQAWHCDEGCFPVALAAGEDCRIGWTYAEGASPRFAPPPGQ